MTPPPTQHPDGKISPGVLALGVPRNVTLGFPPTLLAHVREGGGSRLAAARPETLWCNPHDPQTPFRVAAGKSLYLLVTFSIGSRT